MVEGLFIPRNGGTAAVALFLLRAFGMSPLSKILIAVVLFVPGGLLFAPLLWLERRWHQRRSRVATPAAEQRAAA